MKLFPNRQEVGLVRPAAMEKEKDEKFFHSGRWKLSEDAELGVADSWKGGA